MALGTFQRTLEPAEVSFTDRIERQRKLAEVGQTSVSKDSPELHEVSKTAVHTASACAPWQR